jgi:DNA-binding CsgD family transcriptional regulator
MINQNAIEYNNSILPVLKGLSHILLKEFNITTFSYLKFLKNGQMIHISNQKKWLEYYVNNALYNDTKRYTREIRMVQRKEKKFFLRLPTNNYSFEKIMHDFGLCYGISFYQEFDDYVEMFGFATDSTNSNIMELYINDIEFLKRFSIFFKDKGKELIDHNDKEKLITPDNSPNWVQPLLTQGDRQRFLMGTATKHFPISANTFLSLREAQCLYYSLKGSCTKNTARKLNISPRTVESYLSQVKVKSQGISLSSAISKDSKNYLNNIMIYFECEEL